MVIRQNAAKHRVRGKTGHSYRCHVRSFCQGPQISARQPTFRFRPKTFAIPLASQLQRPFLSFVRRVQNLLQIDVVSARVRKGAPRRARYHCRNPGLGLQSRPNIPRAHPHDLRLRVHPLLQAVIRVPHLQPAIIVTNYGSTIPSTFTRTAGLPVNLRAHSSAVPKTIHPNTHKSSLVEIRRARTLQGFPTQPGSVIALERKGSDQGSASSSAKLRREDLAMSRLSVGLARG